MKPSSEVLSLAGPRTIREIAGSYDQVLQHVSSNASTVVDMQGSDQVDALTVQLLVAAHLFASKKGKALTVKFGEGSPFSEAMKTLGVVAMPAGAARIEGGAWIGLRSEQERGK